MDIASGLAATSNAITLVKALKDADSALDTATLKARLAEVMSQLADAKMAQVELIEKNADLTKENERLLTADADIGSLKEIDGYLYRSNETGDVIGWPACPSCLNKGKIIVILIQDGDVENAVCPRCHVKLHPVTSFVTPGFTRMDQKRQKRADAQARANAQIRSRNRDWMA